jgi:hypothetical protein
MLIFHVKEFMLENNLQQNLNPKNEWTHFKFSWDYV